MNKAIKTVLLVLLDILLAAAILCVFAYYHHIRYLWGGVETPTNGGGLVFDNPFDDNSDDKEDSEPNVGGENENDPSGGEENPDKEEDDGYDRSGDFGEKFYDKFLKKGEAIISTDTQY